MVLGVRHLPNLTVDLLLGLDVITELKIIIDSESGQFLFQDDPDHVYSFVHPQVNTVEACHGVVELNEAERLLVDEALQPFKQIQWPDNTCTDVITHYIDVGGAKPIKQRPYHVNPKLQAVIHQEVDKMLAEGVIEPCTSPWSNPIVLVKKSNGEYRFCLDFRKLNEVTRKDNYPLPRIESILDRLRAAKYLSKIDLKAAYWNIPLDESCRDYTAFAVFGRGLFRFTRMAFGLTGATGTMQRVMDMVLGPGLEPDVFEYLDDVIVVGGDTLQAHIDLISEVLRRLSQAKLKINWEKSEFCMRELEYLGFRVNATGLQISESKVQPVLDYPAPKDIKALRRFLGMCSWYRRFIPDFADTTKPLTQLLKLKQKWEWGAAQEESFLKLKTLLSSPPILIRPDFDKPFSVQTDASFSGLGAVLTQNIDGKEHVIAYASRQMIAAELNYTVTEKECLAAVFGIKKFRPYLEGYRFTLVTDHSSLKWLFSLNNPTPRLARWALELQSYNFDIIHRKGTAHQVPDALSRSIVPGDKESPVSLVGAENPPLDAWYDKKVQDVLSQPEKFPDFRVQEGRLYKRRFDSLELVLEESSHPWKLVLRKPEISKILFKYHDQEEAGHLGLTKTYKRIAWLYYWPGMWESVAQYVRSCKTCQKVKTVPEKAPGLMHSNPSDGPWKKVSVDIMGPYPRSSKGNLYILVFLDTFSKWVELVALRATTSAVIIEQLKKCIIYRYGAPSQLLSDNGTYFISQEMKNAMSTFNIKHELTAPYWPQANPVERANRNIKQILRSFTNERQRNWDAFLPELAFALNTSVHESTGYTPALVNYGREISATVPTTYSDQPKDNAPALHVKHLEGLKDLYDWIQVNQLKSSRRQAGYYDRNHREVKYEVGDLVLRQNFKLSSAAEHYAAGLDFKYLGPFRIEAKLSPVVYSLVDAANRPAGRWHVKHLKPYTSRPEVTQ
ncbi:hypothetical protein M8J77_001280 [Diaphorina citri]|nr:hypothetical protein M8J77_001280 [Diaphorina citri]